MVKALKPREPKHTCFVIAPIGDDRSKDRESVEALKAEVLVPVLGEEYEIVVAHEIAEPERTVQILGRHRRLGWASVP